MSQIIGILLLLFSVLVIGFIWYCILCPDELSSDQILWMEEQGKKQMREAGWSEEDIDKVHEK